MNMGFRLAALCVALWLTAPAAEAQNRRVYAGNEAEALKCAYLISQTANLLERAGRISTTTRENAVKYAAYILLRYVGGTQEQKMAAFKAVGQRRTLLQTVVQFDREVKYCRGKFPVR
jgi:hypothetical protein